MNVFKVILQQNFASRRMFSTNHKDIGVLCLLFGGFSGILGTTISSTLIRSKVLATGSFFLTYSFFNLDIMQNLITISELWGLINIMLLSFITILTHYIIIFILILKYYQHFILEYFLNLEKNFKSWLSQPFIIQKEHALASFFLLISSLLLMRYISHLQMDSLELINKSYCSIINQQKVYIEQLLFKNQILQDKLATLIDTNNVEQIWGAGVGQNDPYLGGLLFSIISGGFFLLFHSNITYSTLSLSRLIIKIFYKKNSVDIKQQNGDEQLEQIRLAKEQWDPILIPDSKESPSPYDPNFCNDSTEETMSEKLPINIFSKEARIKTNTTTNLSLEKLIKNRLDRFNVGTDEQLNRRDFYMSDDDLDSD